MKIIDLHNDYLTELNDKQVFDYLKNNQRYLHLLCSPIWTTELENPINFIEKTKKYLKKINVLENNFICIEDMCFFDDNKKENILDIRPLYCGLCWNYENKFCGGAYSEASLTQKGKLLVKFLEKNNILVDCAHMNEKSFFNLASITTKPMFCSHTGFKSVVCDNRNLSDEQIKQIVKSNGLIGFYFVGKYISKNKVKMLDIVKNIEHFVTLYGCDNLAIGSDFYGTTDLAKNLCNYSHISNLIDMLKKSGFSKIEIEKIFKLNAMSFLKNFTG